MDESFLGIISRSIPADLMPDLPEYLEQNPDVLDDLLRDQYLFEKYPGYRASVCNNLIGHPDPLTGLYNRRMFDRDLYRKAEEAEKEGRQVALILDDLDWFKRVNDAWGHEVGNEVLRRTAGIKRDCVRPTDSLYRVGGEEGAIILPETGMAEALVVADRIRLTISSMDLRNEVERDLELYSRRTRANRHDQRRRTELEMLSAALSKVPPPQITISQGIGTYPHVAIGNAAGLKFRTDDALYQAKASGRNRACTIDDLGNGA